MRIALLTDGIWPFVLGGMQKHSYYVCKHLAKNGVYVDLYHTAADRAAVNLKACFSEAELKYITAHFIEYPNKFRLPGHYIKSSHAYSKLLYDQFMRGAKVDLIYSKGLTGWEFFRRRNKGQSLPVICINVHGYEYFQKAASAKSRIEQFILRPPFKYVNRHADYIFSYGGKITRLIKQQIQGTEQRIIELPTGIDSEYLINDMPVSAKRRKFVFIGRYERRKGIKELLQSFAAINSKSEFDLTIVGYVPEDKKLLMPNINYRGVIHDKEELKSVLRASDILVCPSYSEGMPNVIMEAMASGCAIIASDVGAVSEQVDDSNGWLVKAGSIQSLASAITSALAVSDAQLSNMRYQSVLRIKDRFLWEVVSQKLVRVLDDISIRHATSPGLRAD